MHSPTGPERVGGAVVAVARRHFHCSRPSDWPHPYSSCAVLLAGGVRRALLLLEGLEQARARSVALALSDVALPAAAAPQAAFGTVVGTFRRGLSTATPITPQSRAAPLAAEPTARRLLLEACVPLTACRHQLIISTPQPPPELRG